MDIIVSSMDNTPIYEQITRQIKAKPRRRAAAGGGATVYACWRRSCASALSRPSVRIELEYEGISPARPDAAALLHRSAANVCGKRSFAQWKTT
ncbi:MAG: hypothetical protein ACLSGI_11235 [Butyricicoccaceae bacterium]